MNIKQWLNFVPIKEFQKSRRRRIVERILLRVVISMKLLFILCKQTQRIYENNIIVDSDYLRFLDNLSSKTFNHIGLEQMLSEIDSKAKEKGI